MELKIALITNQSIHHNYWAYMLYKNLNVKLIIHPIPKRDISSILKKRKKIIQKGFFKTCLKIASIIFNIFFGHSRQRRFIQVSNKMMGDYKEYYETIPKDIFHFPIDINDDSVTDLIRENEIDYIFFLMQIFLSFLDDFPSLLRYQKKHQVEMLENIRNHTFDLWKLYH